MKKIYGIYEAKTHFSKLIDEIVAGTEVIIERSGSPVAVIKPVLPQKKPRRFGSEKGKFKIEDSFFDPLPQAFTDFFG